MSIRTERSGPPSTASGTTLNDIAKAQRVSTDDLTAALKKDLKANKPTNAPELSDDQLTEMATSIASGKRPQGPPPGGGMQRPQVGQVNVSDGTKVDVFT